VIIYYVGESWNILFVCKCSCIRCCVTVILWYHFYDI